MPVGGRLRGDQRREVRGRRALGPLLHHDLRPLVLLLHVPHVQGGPRPSGRRGEDAQRRRAADDPRQLPVRWAANGMQG